MLLAENRRHAVSSPAAVEPAVVPAPLPAIEAIEVQEAPAAERVAQNGPGKFEPGDLVRVVQVVQRHLTRLLEERLPVFRIETEIACR